MNVSRHELHKSDVLVIGAGASGGVAALRLAEAGLSVVALEQGDWQVPEKYRGSEWDWELTAEKQWSMDPQARAAPADYPIDSSDSDMRVFNFNGVGGGTVLFNALWPRLLESHFCTNSRFGIADDWPLSYRDLQPFYDEIDRQVGVSGLGGDPAYPPGREPPLPQLPFGPGPLKIARIFARKGWHWWPENNAILSTAYDGRHQCVGRGTCGQGCNEGAKSSIDVTHWRKFVARGGALKTGARVQRITIDDQGLATGAIWVSRDGSEHFHAANIVLCAANAIGTPRLLLASACSRFPNGLANSSDLVGRRLMLHPLAMVQAYFEEQFRSWQGHYGSTVHSLEFGQDDFRRGFRGGAKWSLHPMAMGPLMEAMRVLKQGGTDYHGRHKSYLGHGLQFTILCEDMPDPENRVTLSTNIADADGIPAPKIHYRYSPDILKSLEWNTARAVEVFDEAGAREIVPIPAVGGCAHLMGTARMGDDPRTSVVDRWCMSHDIPNLGVIDGSVFVTSGSVNPTSTITALALRAAEHLIAERKNIPRSARADAKLFDLKPARSPAKKPRESVALSMLPEQTSRLAALGDALIPAIDDVPAAGTLIVGANLVSKVVDVRPDLHPALLRALAPFSQDAPARVAVLKVDDADAWVALATVVAGAYYIDERVRRRIGYEGQVPTPQQPDRYPAFIDEGLLDHILSASWRERWDAREIGVPTRNGLKA
jgi:choline dehydrogenase-like flavoprotein